MYGYIYITTNLLNGKRYVGQHKGEFNENYKGSGIYLLKAIAKYGKQNFKTIMVEKCYSKQEMDCYEKLYISFFGCNKNRDIFYNIACGGEGGDTVSKLSGERKEEIRKKLSKNSSGKNNPMYGKKSKDFMSKKAYAEMIRKRKIRSIGGKNPAAMKCIAILQSGLILNFMCRSDMENYFSKKLNISIWGVRHWINGKIPKKYSHCHIYYGYDREEANYENNRDKFNA